MTSKIHASMFRTKELSESDGQNNAAISLLLRKKRPLHATEITHTPWSTTALTHSDVFLFEVLLLLFSLLLSLLAARFRFQQTNRHAPCRRESDADGD